MAASKPVIKQPIQQERRQLLIDATMSAIYEHGLSKLTLAKITRIAGLTAATVNFHFDSKEALLLATLKYLSEEFDSRQKTALQQAGSAAPDQLKAVVDASLDPGITESRKMAVWFTFLSEGRARQDYQRICGECDSNNLNITINLCQQIINAANKQRGMSAKALACALSGLIDEVWQSILYVGDDYDRADAKNTCYAFLASVFPWCFAMPQQSLEPSLKKKFTILQATELHLPQLAEIFDCYRQFYQIPSNPKNALHYLSERLQNKQSVIYMALDDNNSAVGFCQLYPSFCSVDGGAIWILYDLYVNNTERKNGVAQALMETAKQMAVTTGALRIDLETATDNFAGQALYEKLGYQQDNEFYKYSLKL
ncbi:MAG: AcrR family transcriptional regulator/ribosomal protein S18 acetylase RimI-like enzyme [Oceanicoccus sp.]|jgi:AcrR family transcriptional regulator/ribosomal protein S18 acetylase RimI-like enzyme